MQSSSDHACHQATDVLIPLIRAAATIGFAIAPCSLGFVIIAVSEQLIRSIMVGDDPEMLLSELQNRYPNEAIEVADKDHNLVARVVDLIDRDALQHEVQGKGEIAGYQWGAGRESTPFMREEAMHPAA
jgi:hypothetical protein